MEFLEAHDYTHFSAKVERLSNYVFAGSEFVVIVLLSVVIFQIVFFHEYLYNL